MPMTKLYMSLLGYNLEETEKTLCFDFDLVSKWFEDNCMVLNADVTLCALVRIRKMKLLSLIILSSITAMKRKYLGLPLTTS